MSMPPRVFVMRMLFTYIPEALMQVTIDTLQLIFGTFDSPGSVLQQL